jgi:zinc transporter ZupT
VLLAWSSIWLISSGVAFLVGWVTPVGLEDGDAGVVKQTIGNIVSGLTGGAMIAYTSATMLPAAFERSGRNATVAGLLCTIGFVAALTMEVFAGPMDATAGDDSASSLSAAA